MKLIVEQMKQIAGRYAPIFVTGDMNASYAAGDGRRTCLDGFFEFMWSARETAPDGEADDVYSYNNFGEGTPRFTWNIDHIFYRKVTPVRFRTINNDGYGVPLHLGPLPDSLHVGILMNTACGAAPAVPHA